MFKPKGHHVRQSQVEKFTRYSIRKVSFGAASVAVATGLFFLGGGSVQAAEQLTNPEPTEVQNSQNLTDKSSEPSKEVAGQASATAKEPDGQNNTSVKESTTDKQASEVETPKVVTEKVAINTASLEDLAAKAESRLSQLTEGKKTKSVIDDAKNLVNKAKELLNDDTKTQTKVDALAKQLSSSLVILNSIKSEATEEKVNKNQDPRNGQAIPSNGESGFRADTSGNGGTTTVTNDELTPTTPAQPTAKNIIGSTSAVSRENFTGWDTYKMPFGVQSGSGTLGVDSAEQKANAEGLQFRVFSDQRAGTRVTPGPSNFTFELQPSDVKARVDYGLKLPAEEVQKIIEEAPLWRGKLKYNNTRIQSSAASTYFGGGPYEYLLSSIYKLGYEQGIDKVYVKDASKRIEVTEEAKAAGWTVSDFTVSNMPGGLVYDKQSDSIQGVVTHSSPFNYQKLVATVTFTNTKTGKNVRIPLDLHRYGGTAWKDGTPPTLEINDAVKEGKVGEELVVPVEYRDAGASHAGAPNGRNIPYSLTDENGNPLNRTATIRETVGRAILGVSGVKITGTTGAGASTVTDLTGDDTKIPGVGFTIASNDMTERNKNGFKGTPTEAGIYRVSIYARDYKETNANEAYAHATFKISPAVSVKNVHAYDKEVPITISRGASEATITLPDGTNTKVVAKDGKWVVTETTNTAVNVNDEIGTVGETFNLKVLPTATAKAATDNIKVTASSENVTATFTRAEVALKTKLGENVTATFNKSTGRWDLPAEIAEKKTVNSDGTTTWLKRDLYVDVDKNGETIFNVYEYTRTLNAEGKVTAVSDPTRTLTTYNKENAANSAAESANDANKGMVVTVKYDKGLNKWTADDNSTVTATKTGDKWTISTSSGFNGTVDAVYAESSDKASVLNDAPTVHSTSYTTVKGATVDLVKQKSATVTITDREDDATTAPTKKETTVTKVTLTAPSGKVTEYTSVSDAAAVKLTETGEYTVKVDVKDSNGNKVTADSDTATGTNENDNSAVASTTYVITVKDQETNKLYKVEDDTVTNDELKAKVTPTTVEGFTPSKNDITDIPTTTGKAGQTLPTPATVTYTKDTETIQVETKVDVVVLPKVTPTGVTVLKDSTNLENVVKEKAKEAVKAIATDKIPTGVTVSIKEVKAGTLPGTTTIGDQTPAKVVVEYKDANNNVVETREVEVPVTVVGSTVNKIVKFEDDELTDEEVKAAVTPGTNGTKGEPLLTANITAEPGTKEVAIPVTYNNGELSERVVVPVVVLPTAIGEVEVPKGSTVDKVKEVTKAKATEVATSAEFKAKLPEGSKDVVVGEITEKVLATMTAEKGTNKGIVKVPVTYTVDGKTYTKDAEITVNVLGSEAKPVYTLEGTKPEAEKVKNAVTPGNGGTVNTPTEAGLPETTGKAGAKDVTATTTVTYPTGDETVKVPVEVLPKATPEKVITLKDTTGDNLTTAVKEKAQAALSKLTLPTGVTAELNPNQTYSVPATDSNGDKTAVPVKVQYKDATGTVVAEDTINVPVTVVSSTPSKIVVFEGETPTAEQAKTAVTPGTDGTKGEPTTLPETTGKAGATDVKVDVPVTYDNGKLTETVSVPVTVLPKPEADEILVAKNSDKDKAKEKVLAKAKKAIEDSTFTGKLPQGATVTIDETATVTVPDLTEDTEVDVTVKYTVDNQEKTTTVKVPVTVVEGVPQIVPVKENNDVLPNPEKSIDKTDYPKGFTFRYKTPEGQTTPIDVTTPGDKNVVVEVLDPQGNTIVEVPATVRVVGSTPQFVVADPTKKQPEAKDSITPGEYPEGTTFEYKTPVDTTTSGEKDVTVVAKLNGQPIAEVPAKVVVVDPKTQYVVADPSKPQPDASKSIDPEQYPDGTTFEYKTPVDTTTPGEKDVVVVAKDGEDKLVEVPTKVKVVQGNPQIVPVDEGKKQPSPEDSIDSNDYPEDATFEYKEEVDTSTPGDKKVTVVVKQGDKVLVEVPSTVRVVESYPKYVPVDPTKKQPDPKENINPNDFPTGTTFEYKDNTPVDTTTPGEKDVTVVAKLNGQPITEIPAKIVVVESKTQYVPVNAENDKKPKPQDSITPYDYPEGSTFEYKTPEGKTESYDGSTPGEKDVTVVVKDSDGDRLVEVPAKIKVVQGKEQQIPVNAEGENKPKPEDSITPSDYPEGSTFEYKVPEGQTTPYDGTTSGDKPVTVVVKDKDGKVLVEVPATIKVVETKPTPIETPVTNTPLTEGDYTKGMKIPEGATVKVGDLPDLTTPGKKDPVKVTITLPNRKSYTVDVPVTVTPVTPIETPVTKDKLTPEDILKQIKVPEGATTKVENIPDLTTPGKKDPVKVTITLPNGKVVTVEVPVNVTPIKDIVKKQGDPITAEDVENHIPKGAKVISIGDKPTTDVPGERPSIPVVIELPNGIRVTMDIPVIVTPTVTPVVVPVGTPVTPEDVQKHIELPNGWKVTKVGEIPTTSTPGTKPVVPVEIELPDGRKITVDVPVIVTPTVRQIVVPQGTPITPDDVKGHIDLPKEPGWEIVEVGEIPTTIPAGVKPSVKVKIKVPTGEIVEVEVPIIVTPKVTPIVVEVGTPITENDVKKRIDLPEGWEIVEVGKIPTTETPGAKPVVKVKVKLPDGRIITVEVPVTVTPKSQNSGGIIAQNGGSTVQIVTEYLDENGNRITSDKEGKHNPIELEGYEFSHSTTDAKGNTLHHYKKVKKPINQETPTSPEKPVATPVQTSSTDSKQVAETTVSNDKKELPNTGTEDKAGLASLGLLGMLGAFGLVARKKKED
ncbi:Rib/alpha-like domain-containing protein [uncultured Streptococcus sp.]|uniref:Rib/alpha-like domain-containing protein n=1 Tax=uncultured Streptococcus sp. TaxID=83427 RepID=UPI0028D5C7EC|nr:Rib/alpha-like domain-containing protein [uncultured Streptococcus sp.]